MRKSMVVRGGGAEIDTVLLTMCSIKQLSLVTTGRDSRISGSPILETT